MAPVASLRNWKEVERWALAKKRQAERQDDHVLSFREFINRVNPKYKWSEMSDRLCRVLQRVADGKLKRLMVFLPPRHGKSELVTRMFSAYYLYRYPEKWVGITGYGADLARTFSRAARANFREIGGEISPESAAVDHWETTSKGGCWSAGVGGGITGKGFSLGLIDDPLKDQEAASSSTIREKQKDWYDSTFYTRAEEDAAIIVIQTRWHEDDLSGWLLSKEYDEDPECWHIVSWEAIKEPSIQEFPPSCTIEKDWRKVGEPLNPVRMSLDRLKKICSRIKGYFWQALYMQRPRAPEGNVFKEAWFKRYPRLPEAFEQVYISVDAAFKASTHSSFVVIQAWGVNWPNFYLIDQRRDRMGFVDTKAAIRKMYDYITLEFQAPSAVLVEDKANGPAIMDELRADVPGLLPVTPQGSKEARAEAVSPYFEAGNVWIPTAEVSLFPVKDFVEELLSFPDGATDDQVDAASQLIRWVMQRQKRPDRRQARSRSNW